MFEFLLKFPLTPPEDTAKPQPGDPSASPPSPERELTFDEVRELTQPPRPPSTPASTFAHLTDPDELALSLLSFLDKLDLSCPEIRALIASTEKSYQGGILAAHLAPKTHVGKHRERRRKAKTRPKQPRLASLFDPFPSDD
ncbi:hypothetical protein [Bosea sp. ASV33]|uniref:hypothetical protein n=1 Tax=Bosea sp. ASV33 TaxID=2795106 RepID=UPI0018ECDF23|nr:hypothetical protein [Bosea sp. ASV33]